MIFKVNDGGVEQNRPQYPDNDSTRMRVFERQELFAVLQGQGIIWGPEDYTSESGYRGDPKPDDNSEGEAIILPSPDGSLPPEGEIINDPRAESFQRIIGHGALEYTVDLAA